MIKQRSQSGFTLIETIVYLGIYAILMTGALVSVYSIIESGARNQNKAMAQEEGSFLIGKIDWALTSVKINSNGTSAVTLPVGGASGDTLSLSRSDVTNPIIISIANGQMSITRGSGPVAVINNTNTTITCPATGCFTHTLASGDGVKPESVAAWFTLHATTSQGLPYSQDFFTIKYLRK